jgi:4-amino-4-deoxy-L-arabinose transferase-like glycosyltransferase
VKFRYPGTVAALAISIVAAAWLAVRALVHQPPLLWDESEHVLYGVEVLSHLKGWNWEGFRNASFYQFFWSFLHSWWVGFFLGLSGYSDVAARFSSIVAYAVFLFSMYCAGSRCREVGTARAAGFAAMAAAWIPSSLPDFGVQCMQEVPALMTAGCALWAFREAMERRRPAWWLGAGLLTTVSFFMKYNFGIMLAVAFAILVAVEFLLSREYGFLQALPWVYGPLLLAALHWLVYPEFRVAEFLTIFVNRPQGPAVWSMEGLLFYPRGLFVEGGWWALLLVAGFGVGLSLVRSRWNRLLLILVCCVFGSITLQQTKVYRYLYPAYPGLFLLVGAAVAAWYGRCGSRGVVRWLFLAAGIVFAGRFLYAVEAARDKPEIRYAVRPVVERTVASLIGSTAVLTVGEADLLSAGLVEWELLKRGKRVPVYESMLFKERLAGARPFDADTVVHQADIDALCAVVRERRCDAVVAVDIPSGSPLDNDDYRLFNAWKRPYVRLLVMGVPGFALHETVTNEAMGITVRTYRVASPAAPVE